MGDIFGAPLAVEALLAFFLESTFLGLWVFGWERLSKRTHLLAIWLVAIGSNISALWILIANSFMQAPVGYAVEGGRLVMKDFFSLLTNPYVWRQFPHVEFSGFTTAAFFVIGISVFHLLRKQNLEIFNKSLKIAVIFGLISIIGVIIVGDSQAKQLVTAQPMKLAAAEGLLNTENPASLSIFSIIDIDAQKDMVRVGIPNLLSIMAFNKFDGEVKGMLDLQKEYTQKYGAGDYIPNMFMSYWTFRIMVGLGFLMLAVLIILLYFIIRKQTLPSWKWLAVLFPWVISFPYLANSTGWLLTELGRQPWIVYGLMKTTDGVSVSVNAGEVLATLILYTLVYGVLMVADVYLLVKFAKAGPQEIDLEAAEA